jgi:hypothetical protein
MTDVQVTGADLSLAADAADSAALLVGRTDAASCARALAAALPGSASSAVAAQLATAWAARERTLSGELSGYADELRATAATYGRADGLSASWIEVSGGRTR